MTDQVPDNALEVVKELSELKNRHPHAKIILEWDKIITSEGDYKTEYLSLPRITIE